MLGKEVVQLVWKDAGFVMPIFSDVKDVLMGLMTAIKELLK